MALWARLVDDKPKRKKKSKGASDDTDKADGRAGPKSENVVLQKSASLLFFCILYGLRLVVPLGSNIDCSYAPISFVLTLSSAIDHLNALLAERATLSTRLERARAALGNGHPALAVSPNHLDDKGTPLWERDWNGGTGWGDADDDAEEE